MAAIPVEHLDMEYVDAWLERQINAYEASSGQGSYDQFKNMIHTRSKQQHLSK
jgi:hypothetical protein